MAESVSAAQTPAMPRNPAILRRRNDRRRHYVREWRKFRNLTQERLAERTPFTTGAISQLETGRTGYTQDMLEALAVALDCEPGDLLSRNPFAEGEVIHLFESLPEDKRKDALAILRALGGAG